MDALLEMGTAEHSAQCESGTKQLKKLAYEHVLC